MSEIVSIRDKCALISLTCFHEPDENGEPACRQGGQPGTSYTTIAKAELPEGVDKCDYCDDSHPNHTGFRPNSPAATLSNTDPEVLDG